MRTSDSTERKESQKKEREKSSRETSYEVKRPTERTLEKKNKLERQLSRCEHLLICNRTSVWFQHPHQIAHNHLTPALGIPRLQPPRTPALMRTHPRADTLT